MKSYRGEKFIKKSITFWTSPSNHWVSFNYKRLAVVLRTVKIEVGLIRSDGYQINSCSDRIAPKWFSHHLDSFATLEQK